MYPSVPAIYQLLREITSTLSFSNMLRYWQPFSRIALFPTSNTNYLARGDWVSWSWPCSAIHTPCLQPQLCLSYLIPTKSNFIEFAPLCLGEVCYSFSSNLFKPLSTYFHQDISLWVRASSPWSGLCTPSPQSYCSLNDFRCTKGEYFHLPSI